MPPSDAFAETTMQGEYYCIDCGHEEQNAVGRGIDCPNCGAGDSWAIGPAPDHY